MPTRYWLVDAHLTVAVSRIESHGGVRAAEAAVDRRELDAAHATYAREREGAIPAGHAGPRPSGGVGGTRTGVKCLHAHYAYFLAGGDDPVGRWVQDRLDGLTRGRRGERSESERGGRASAREAGTPPSSERGSTDDV
jgi:hypothetical protein